MSINHGVNLQVLKDTHAKDFYKELKNAYAHLDSKQSIKYFTILLKHLQNSELAIETAAAIVESICKTLYYEEFYQIFINSNAYLLVQKIQKPFYEYTLNIIYMIVERTPDVLDESFVKPLYRILRRRGKKTLIILSKYAQHFDELDDPFAILDLLFHGTERFCAIDTVVQYVNLLSLLVRSFPKFAENRGTDAWDSVCLALDLENTEFEEAAYLSLAGMSTVIQANLPMIQILRDLSNRNLQSAVLSLLLASQLDPKEFDPTFIRKIFKIAENDNSATLLLMRIAVIEPELFSNNLSWLHQNLPTIGNTLQLFLVVFLHDYLRPQISLDRNFALFLNSLFDEGKPAFYKIIVQIISKADLTADSIKLLSSTNLFHKFLKSGGPEFTIYLISTVASTCYTNELIPACQYILNNAQTNDSLWKMATLALIRLCAHPACKKELKRLGAIDYYESVKDDENCKKMALRFLYAIE